MRRIHACAIWIFVCNSIRFRTKENMTLFESKWLFVSQKRSVCWNVYKLCFYCFWYVFFPLIMLKLSRNQIIIRYKIPCNIIHKGSINRVDCFMRQIDSSIHIKKKKRYGNHLRMIHAQQWNNGKMFHENCFNKKLLLLFHLSLGAKIEKKCLWQVSTMFGVGHEKDFTLTKVNVFVGFFHALLTETFIFNIYSFLVRLWRTMLRINEIKTKDESNL